MAKKGALAIIVFLAIAVWGTTPATADLTSVESSEVLAVSCYPAYAMVYNEHGDGNLGYWENIDATICQLGGFCQSFNAQPDEEYKLIVDFAGIDPGLDSLEVHVASNTCTYKLTDLGNTPIIFSFTARQPIETLEMAPYVAPLATPLPPSLLLLGSGLMGLVIFRGKTRA